MTTRPNGRGLILVAEDDAAIADLVAMYLRRDGFEPLVVGDGDAALAAVRAHRPVAVILDIGIPGSSGIEVCTWLRSEGDWTPILFVTARDDEVDRLLGLEIGADDYITKPFSPRELTARVRTVLRRSRGDPAATGTIGLGAVRLDTAGRRAFNGETEVELTATEFDLLAQLLKRPGQVFTREQLLSAVWGYAASAGTRTVDVHIAQLRAKLGPHSPIRTVRGVGYAAEAP